MKIVRMKIDNFKGIAGREYDMSPTIIAVLGENGMGKTSFMDAYNRIYSGQISDVNVRTGAGSASILAELENGVKISHVRKTSKMVKTPVTEHFLDGKRKTLDEVKLYLERYSGKNTEMLSVLSSSTMLQEMEPAALSRFLLQHLSCKVTGKEILDLINSTDLKESELPGKWFKADKEYDNDAIAGVLDSVSNERLLCGRDVKSYRAYIDNYSGYLPPESRTAEIVDQEIMDLMKQIAIVEEAKKSYQKQKKLLESIKKTQERYQQVVNVPLILESQQFTFPESVRKDDALIVFSKRHVLQVAAELQKKKWKVSVVYGSLPYEARRREIERYINGQTDVIVATDAIGMGMNLPIARVVFLETEKYDGVMRRPLLEQEVKQIAGRAGRRGIYEIGFYNAEYGKKHIEHMMKEPSYIPQKAYLDFPETLLSVEGKLSDLLNKWNDLPNENIFLKQNLEEEIKLAKELEEMTDDKDMIYKFVTIPFQTESLVIKDLWKQLFQVELSKEYPDSFLMEFLDQDELTAYNLEQLEEEYKKCDLLYNYFRKFKIEDEKEFLIHYKRALADQISDYLAKQQLPVKKCRECGRALPWNYPYRICNKCYMASSYGFGSLRMANGFF